MPKEILNHQLKTYKQSLDVGIPLRALTEIKDAYEGLSKAYLAKSDFVKCFSIPEFVTGNKRYHLQYQYRQETW